jgi:hypothetical protein
MSDERFVPFALAFLGLGLVAISMFLPVWDEGSVSSFSGISENTLLQSGDGWIALLVAGVNAISLIRIFQSPRRIYWPLVSGIVVIGYAIYLGTNETQRTLCPIGASAISSNCQVAQPGIGVYVLGLGGAALLGSGFMFLRFSKVKADPHALPGTLAPDPMKVLRECPFCKMQIRPDASVCPHCQRESEPWTLKENLWWRHEGGEWLWLDPAGPAGTWHSYREGEPATAES